MVDSKELVEDRGYIPRVASLVSLPLRRTASKKIVKWNGKIKVELHALGDQMPYGKMPRMLDAIVATLILTKDPSWDDAKRRLYIGNTFYAFAEHRLGITRGGTQYRRLREQLGYWMQLAYTITNYSQADTDVGGQFVTCEAWHIKWLDPKRWDENPQWGNECFLQFSEMYIRKIIRENPVPVSFTVLRALNQVKSPLAIDIYLWLNRRMSYLHHSTLVTWDQLRFQFGSEAQKTFKFKQIFKRALNHVKAAWPGLNVTVSDGRGVTLFPSSNPVPTVDETKTRERETGRKATTEGHWTVVARQRVYTTTAMFTATTAIEHLAAAVSTDKCRYCLFDSRNREYHGVLVSGSSGDRASSFKLDSPRSSISHFAGAEDYDPDAVRAELEANED